MEYCSAIKSNDFTCFTPTWSELGGIRLSEISQEVREEYVMVSPMDIS